MINRQGWNFSNFHFFLQFFFQNSEFYSKYPYIFQISKFCQYIPKFPNFIQIYKFFPNFQLSYQIFPPNIPHFFDFWKFSHNSRFPPNFQFFQISEFSLNCPIFSKFPIFPKFKINSNFFLIFSKFPISPIPA